jgi:hypothetical protein
MVVSTPQYLSAADRGLRAFNLTARLGSDASLIAEVNRIWPNFRALFGGAVVSSGVNLASVDRIMQDVGKKYAGKGIPNMKGLQGLINALSGAVPQVSWNPLKILETGSAVLSAVSEGVSEAKKELVSGTKKTLWIVGGLAALIVGWNVYLTVKAGRKLTLGNVAANPWRRRRRR